MTVINRNTARADTMAVPVIDDNEFVMVSPINVKPDIRPDSRFKAGVDVKSGERVREEPQEKDAAYGEDGTASTQAAVSGKNEAVSESPSRVQRVFSALFIVCVIFFAGELAWLFLITPLRPFSLVVVTGIENDLMERNEALGIAGIGAKTSYFSFDTKAAERKLAAVPVIESAKVVKQFPGTARITVIPRKSVALFLRNMNGKLVPVYFDRHGVVFKTGGEGEQKAFWSVPVVSGLEIGPIAEGERLPGAYIPLFENLDKLSSVSPNLYQAISEIEINKKTYDGFDVTLFPSQSPVKIRMTAELDEERIGRAFLLLDVLEAEGVRVSEIDYRTRTASYTVKGAKE
jgi:cell division protein FtsQ